MNAGRLEQVGPPREIYERPASRFVADFIGASSVLRGRGAGPDRIALAASVLRIAGLRAPLPAGQMMELIIRPERVRLAPATSTAAETENTLVATVARLTYLGAQMEVMVTLGDGQRVLALVGEPAPMSLAPGLSVRVTLPADAFMVLG
jgi:ABC-type Fe3+/spermidine/putrescine transport system ATPase subunit